MFHFSTAWKRQTTKRFMTFSGGIEMQRLYNGYPTIDTVLGQCNEVSNSSCTNFRIDLDTFQYTAAFAAICYTLQIENKSMGRIRNPIWRFIPNCRMFLGS